MEHAAIIREMIRHTRQDFLAYFEGTRLSQSAAAIIALAISGDSRLASIRGELETIIPDTNEDGNWQCSYALNTGVMILSLIDFQMTENRKHYENAVEMFFDTIDFKVQEALEKKGNLRPAEDQIRSHPLYIREKAWFDEIVRRHS